MVMLSFLCIIVFLLGLYFYAKNATTEGLTNNNNTTRCPDLLIQKGSRFYLYNSKLAQVPGVNPIEFDNLEDYSEFLDWQRSQNIRCPVLYLQESYDAQGKRVYKTRPSVSEPQGGLFPSTTTSTISTPGPLEQVGDQAYPNTTLLVDASRDNLPYNQKSYPAYDQTNFNIGENTPLDQMNAKSEQTAVSPNPMNDNWGGAEYTQKLIDTGYFKGDEVSVYTSE
jgi:hypothetical protein